MRAAKTPLKPSKTAIVVAGMHRSGTSAITRVMSLLGCDLPKTLLQPSVFNEQGFWESTLVNRLNDEILASAGLKWRDWREFDQSWYDQPQVAELKERALALLDEEFGSSSLFVLKDPRICRLARFWRETLQAFGAKPVIACSLRNPLEVAASLQKRNGLEPALSHLIWLRYVLDAEFDTRGMPRTFASYEGLLDAWRPVIERTGADLGLHWPRSSEDTAAEIDAFLSGEYRHHAERAESVTQNPALPEWLRTTFAILERWAKQEENQADFEELDRVRQEFGKAASAFFQLAPFGEEERDNTRRLRKRLDETAGALAQRETEANVAVAQLKKLRAQLAETTSEMAQRETETNVAAAQLKMLRARLTETADALTQRDREVDVGAAQLKTVKTRLAEAENALTQRDTDIEVGAAQLKSLNARLVETENALVQRDAEIGVSAAQLKSVKARLAETESALVQRDAEMVASAAQTEHARLTADRLAGDLESERNKQIELRAALNRSRSTLGQANAKREAAEREVERLQFELLRIHSSRNWKLGEIFDKAVRKVRRMPPAEPVALLAASSLFDRDWYLAHNPDVASAGIDPALHYFRHGAAEGRDPGPDFSTKSYLKTYKDVAEAGVNPLLHYLLFGKAERRIVLPSEAAKHPGMARGAANKAQDHAIAHPTQAKGAPVKREDETSVQVGSIAAPTEGKQEPVNGREAIGVEVRKTRRSAPATALAELPLATETPASAAPPLVTEEQALATPPPATEVPALAEPPLAAADPLSLTMPRTAEAPWVRQKDLLRNDHLFALELSGLLVGLAAAPDADGGDPWQAITRSAPPLTAFCRMMGVDARQSLRCYLGQAPYDIVGRLSDLPDAAACPVLLFDSVGAKAGIADVWFANDRDITLRFGGERGATHEPCVARLFQYDLSGEGSLVIVAETRLSGDRVDFVDAALTNPFLPVLITVATAEGLLLSASLLPFPSLCRGGIHYGELCAVGVGASYLDDLRTVSEALLSEMLGDKGTAPGFSVGRIDVDLQGATGAERIFSAEIREWLAAVMHVRVAPGDPSAGARRSVRAHLAESLAPVPVASRGHLAERIVERERIGSLGLTVPADGVPSLSALVSRRLGLRAGMSCAVGTFVVAESATGRPEWAVTVPPMGEELLALQPTSSGIGYPRLTRVSPGEPKTGSDSSVPLAVRFCDTSNRNEARLIMPIAPDAPGPLLRRTLSNAGEEPTFSVLLPSYGEAGEALAAFLESLQFQTVADRVDIVALADASQPERNRIAEDALQRFFPGRYRLFPHNPGETRNGLINLAASYAAGRLLLVVGEGIVLHDPRTLETLRPIAGHDNVASTGCLLVQTVMAKKVPVVKFRSGGIYPSLPFGPDTSVPTFSELDCYAAFPLATYPVVGNSSALFMVRADTWQKLGGFDGANSSGAYGDIEYGVRALAKGFVHLCTSAVSAGLHGDDLGAAYTDVAPPCSLPFESWQDIAASATTLRVLRG